MVILHEKKGIKMKNKVNKIMIVDQNGNQQTYVKYKDYKKLMKSYNKLTERYSISEAIKSLANAVINSNDKLKKYDEITIAGNTYFVLDVNEEKHEDNLNDLEADTNGGRTDANGGRTESESVAKSIKEEQRLTFSVSDITFILSAYQNKVMNKDLNDLEAVAKSIKEEHALVDFRVPDIALILFAYQIKMKHDQD